MSLTGKTPGNTYKDLLQMNNSNSGLDTVTKNVVDGEGTASALYLSDDVVKIKPQNDDTTYPFIVGDKDNNTLFKVDSSGDLVKAGIGQHIVNTGYLEYGCGSIYTTSWTSGAHFPIPANTMIGSYAASSTTPNLGTGADPDLSYEITNSASSFIKAFHYIPDNITIDQIYIWLGNEDAASDVVRFHLLTFDIEHSSGATAGDWSNGAIIASGADITTTDRARLHYQTIAASPADVDAGQILVLTCEQATINSDISISAKIKYHLR